MLWSNSHKMDLGEEYVTTSSQW